MPHHKDTCVVKEQLHAFLTSALDWNELSASCCGHFTPKWAADISAKSRGPGTSQDTVNKNKMAAHAGNWTLITQLFGQELRYNNDHANPSV